MGVRSYSLSLSPFLSFLSSSSFLLSLPISFFCIQMLRYPALPDSHLGGDRGRRDRDTSLASVSRSPDSWAAAGQAAANNPSRWNLRSQRLASTVVAQSMCFHSEGPHRVVVVQWLDSFWENPEHDHLNVRVFLCRLQKPEQCSFWNLGSQQHSCSYWSWQA